VTKKLYISSLARGLKITVGGPSKSICQLWLHPLEKKETSGENNIATAHNDSSRTSFLISTHEHLGYSPAFFGPTDELFIGRWP